MAIAWQFKGTRGVCPKSTARRYIVSASSDGEIRVWDIARPSEPLRTAHTSARITALAVRTISAWALASMREYA